MPSRRERYLSLAVEAYEMAVRAPDEAKRIGYLKVARQWLALAEQPDGPAVPPRTRTSHKSDLA